MMNILPQKRFDSIYEICGSIRVRKILLLLIKNLKFLEWQVSKNNPKTKTSTAFSGIEFMLSK